jgi:hypothetical protein
MLRLMQLWADGCRLSKTWRGSNTPGWSCRSRCGCIRRRGRWVARYSRMFRSGRTGCVRGRWSFSASTSCSEIRSGFLSLSALCRSASHPRRKQGGRGSRIFRSAVGDGSVSENRLPGWRLRWLWLRWCNGGEWSLCKTRRSSFNRRSRCGRRTGFGSGCLRGRFAVPLIAMKPW